MPITSYSQEPSAAYAGMVADLALFEGLSRRNSESSLTIPVGCIVVQDPVNTDGCLLPKQAAFSGTTPGFLGVQYKLDRMPAADGTTAAQLKDMVPVLRKGRLWVTCEDAVVAADLGKQGRVRGRCLASGGNTQLGAFRNSADSDVDSVFFINGAVFLKVCGAGGLTVVEIPDGATLTLGS